MRQARRKSASRASRGYLSRLLSSGSICLCAARWWPTELNLCYYTAAELNLYCYTDLLVRCQLVTIRLIYCSMRTHILQYADRYIAVWGHIYCSMRTHILQYADTYIAAHIAVYIAVCAVCGSVEVYLGLPFSSSRLLPN